MDSGLHPDPACLSARGGELLAERGTRWPVRGGPPVKPSARRLVGCLVSTAVLLVELGLLQYRAGWLGRSALSPEPESGILRPARLVPRWGWVLRG